MRHIDEDESVLHVLFLEAEENERKALIVENSSKVIFINNRQLFGRKIGGKNLACNSRACDIHRLTSCPYFNDFFFLF